MNVRQKYPSCCIPIVTSKYSCLNLFLQHLQSVFFLRVRNQPNKTTALNFQVQNFQKLPQSRVFAEYFSLLVCRVCARARACMLYQYCCTLNLLKRGCYFIWQQAQHSEFSGLPTECICVFCMVLRPNGTYFPLQSTMCYLLFQYMTLTDWVL